MKKVRTCVTKITLNERTYRNVSFEPSLINFFYGGNGAGKSTIGKAIKAKRGLTWDAPSSEGIRLMVFNEDYIKDNIQSYGNIPGVFTLTEEDAAVRKELDGKTKEKGEADIALKTEEGRTSDIINQELSLAGKYAAQVWSKTTGWRKTDFPKATAGYGNSKDKFFQELYKRPRVQADHASLLTTYAAVYETEPVRYQPYTTINWENSLPTTDLLRKPIISMSDTEFAKFVRALGNLDWVRHGHDRYMEKADGRCPFCQGPMDAEKFERDLASCYDDQYRQDQENLQRFDRAYRDALNQIHTVLKANLGNPFPVDESLAKSYQYEFDMFMEKARANAALLEQKLKEPSTEVYDFEDLSPYLHKIADVITLINKAISDYMALVNDPKKKDKAGKDIWSFMAYECRGLFEDYDREKAAIEAAKKTNGDNITQIKNRIAALKADIDRLNTYTANTTEVMEQINNTLRSIGFKGFRLREKQDASYVYELIREGEDGKDDIAKDLSEGERNFIAFLYFYHTVMGSQNRDGRTTDKIVVIDDPVSSMDHNTLFYVCRLTRELVDICYNNCNLEGDEDMHIKQFFCLTHNPIYFRDITYNRLSDYECVTFFEITKDEDNHSHVDEQYDEIQETGTTIRVNRSPVRNYYDSLWHIYRTTGSKEALMTTARQILDYYFLQNDGYNSTKFRELLFKGNNKEQFTSEDPIYYRIADSMVAFLSVGASNFNDGLFFDTAPYTLDQMRKAFRTIFDVMGRTYHYNAKMGTEN